MKSLEGNFDNTEVNNLLLNHFKELKSVSPEGSAHVLDIPGLMDSSIKFWSIWENNLLVGCGAIKFLSPTHGEFKSIRVANDFRKKDLKLNKLSIETGSGDFFKPARKLFEKIGFKKCEPFAHYKEDPNSCYMNLNI